MNARELIRKKHAGGELSEAEIAWLVGGAVSGDIPDYQLSALLMAICYEHLSFAETVAFTKAFVESGETLSWPPELGTFIDKHSTGGVGDKVSLIILPLLASLGFKVAKMSGHALGHTGGTIDKLESIPGFRTKLTREEMLRVVQDVGCCIVEQSAELVPADQRFYALRDATDTVSELGLIAASVMSKKLACGAPLIVLDVKCGSGAFFKTLDEARAFAQLAKRIGEHFGRRVGCVISSMEQPLGEAVGNAIEVLEVLRVFKCDSIPHELDDVREVVEELCASALRLMPKLDYPNYTGRMGIQSEFKSLKPLEEHFRKWISAQGGDLAGFVEEYAAYFAEQGISVKSANEGYVRSISTDKLGETLASLGAGRSKKGETVDHKVGLLCHAKIGDKVQAGDKLVTLYMGDSQADPAEAAARISSAFHIGPEPVSPVPVVLDRIL